ncbi:hypothetical protein [Owenweeksia hongkongensis]|uniref:hypothetical protein n=1 Tax=Owenweeksia hongkongensis TaxID=253245 RepID=UPI003A90D928
MKTDYTVKFCAIIFILCILTAKAQVSGTQNSQPVSSNWEGLAYSYNGNDYYIGDQATYAVVAEPIEHSEHLESIYNLVVEKAKELSRFQVVTFNEVNSTGGLNIAFDTISTKPKVFIFSDELSEDSTRHKDAMAAAQSVSSDYLLVIDDIKLKTEPAVDRERTTENVLYAFGAEAEVAYTLSLINLTQGDTVVYSEMAKSNTGNANLLNKSIKGAMFLGTKDANALSDNSTADDITGYATKNSRNAAIKSQISKSEKGVGIFLAEKFPLTADVEKLLEERKGKAFKISIAAGAESGIKKEQMLEVFGKVNKELLAVVIVKEVEERTATCKVKARYGKALKQAMDEGVAMEIRVGVPQYTAIGTLPF